MYDSMGVGLDAIDRASKFARYAVSSLQFEDVEAAIANLLKSLQELGYSVKPEN